MQKIAIIGSGISGLTAAHLLSEKHEVHVFEADSRIGGHTATVDVEVASGRYAIDTGFIVFNDWTYPNFIRLMNKVGVTYQDSDMGFSVKSEKTGIEYNGKDLSHLFIQKRNLIRPSFYRMLLDILRFNRESLSLLKSEEDQSQLTLGEYLRKNKYSPLFIDHYIFPMGAAIWSAHKNQMDAFPAQFFVRFFKNHGMLSVDERPIWKVICGGSRSYLEPLTKDFKKNIHLNSPILNVVRKTDHVELTIGGSNPETQSFDHVVFATHSDQTKKILADMREKEKEILGAFDYQPNEVVLHTDKSVLPRNKKAWASWNSLVLKEEGRKVALSYNMNILQGFSSPEDFIVSLNMTERISPDRVLKKFIYDHPIFTRETVRAQSRWAEISGLPSRTHFCGAYWGYGFHEDGVKSGLKVAQCFGVESI